MHILTGTIYSLYRVEPLNFSEIQLAIVSVGCHHCSEDDYKFFIRQKLQAVRKQCFKTGEKILPENAERF